MNLIDFKMQKKTFIVLLQFILCGFKIVRAIIGHNIRPTQENEFPSVVCITAYDPNLDWQTKMICSGTLISNNFILTAAHCFQDAPHIRFEVSMGAHLVENGERYYPVWWITFDQWASLNVQNYVLPPIMDDIQLIKIFGVWRNIPPSQVGPINPPTLMRGLHATIVGCGQIENNVFPATLHTAPVTIIDLNACSEVISHLDEQIIQLDDKYSCSIGVPYTQLAAGDSGGPLMYYGVVIGINIAVCPKMNNTFHPNKVNIHVNMFKYENFLAQMLLTDP